MARKTIKEIVKEGLNEDIWRHAERDMVRRERNKLRRAGRIRPFAVVTPLVRKENGPISTINGGNWTIGFSSIHG